MSEPREIEFETSRALEIQQFSNVVVVPFNELLAWGKTRVKHQGGPIWPDWCSRRRVRFNGSFYPPSDIEPSYSEPVRQLEGRNYFYIGPIYKHFGHQIRDFSSRIYPSISADPDAVLVFATHWDHVIQAIEHAPRFLIEILQWYEHPLDRVEIVTEPTRFDLLNVALEPEAPLDNPDGLMPDPLLIEGLTRFAAKKQIAQTSSRKIYVSRTRFFSQLLGEMELERLLEIDGFDIFYPEKHSLEEQITAYLSAGVLIFAEGSAVHALQLAGRSFAEVYVLKRRSNARLFLPIIRSRSKRSSLVDAIRGVLRFSVHSDKNVAVLDYDLVKRFLEGVAPAASREMARKRFRESQKKQLRTLVFSTMPRTLRSSFALIQSLLMNKPPSYRITFMMVIMLIPIDYLLRVRKRIGRASTMFGQ